MNHYEADISQLIKARFGKKPLDFDAMAETMVKEIADPNHRRMMVSAARSIGMSQSDAETVAENAPSQWFWELLNVKQGVAIEVNDAGLIDAMLRTDIEALMGDVRVPFPICEFSFPKGIPLGDLPFHVSGCLIVSIGDGSLFRKAYAKHGVDMKEELLDGYAFFTRLVRQDGSRDRDGVSWLRFRPDESLASLPSMLESLPRQDRQATQMLVRLVMGLCLYFQTQEGQKALVKNEGSHRRENVSPAEGRALKKRQSLRVLDLITHKLRDASEALGGSHASPKAHWRKLHMRTLRSDRFKRNPNGSVKAIWIRPMLVGAKDGDSNVHARRRVGTSAPNESPANQSIPSPTAKAPESDNG